MREIVKVYAVSWYNYKTKLLTGRFQYFCIMYFCIMLFLYYAYIFFVLVHGVDVQDKCTTPCKCLVTGAPNT